MTSPSGSGRTRQATGTRNVVALPVSKTPATVEDIERLYPSLSLVDDASPETPRTTQKPKQPSTPQSTPRRAKPRVSAASNGERTPRRKTAQAPAPSTPTQQPKNVPVKATRATPEASGEFVSRQLSKTFDDEAEEKVTKKPDPSAPSVVKIPWFNKGMGLKNFQREDYERIVQREQTPDDERYSTGFIVGSEMGTGKTAVALAVICKGLDPECPRPGQPRATLVLVPGPGVLSNWTREITKFAPGLRVVVYHGAKRGTDVDALKKQDIILATYAQVVGQYKKYLNDEDGVMLNHPFFDFKFHRVILDEAHEIRNPETQRAKACFALCKVHGLCLTGTPAQNSARDFGSYFCFLSVRDHDLGKIDAFNDVIAQPIDDGEHGEALRILTTALSRLMIYRKLRLVAKLEDRYETRIDIEMKPQERAVYNYVLTMPGLRLYPKLIRLRQVATHPTHVTHVVDANETNKELLGKSSSEEDKCEENNEKEDLAALIPVENGQLSLPDALNDTREVFDMSYLSSKIEKTSEIIQKIRQRPGDQKTIVFAFFKLTLDILESALKKHGIHCVQYTGEMSTNQRDNALIQIRDNPKYTVILMSLLAGAVGINVTSCSNVIIMEPWWNPYVEEQAIARAHRMGQTRGVTVYRLVVLGTIEERIAELQEKKKNTIDRVLNNMPARLSVQELDTLQNGL